MNGSARFARSAVSLALAGRVDGSLRSGAEAVTARPTVVVISPGVLMLADGRFPSGGHAQSVGVEAAVRAGDVRDEGSLDAWLRGRLATTGSTDAAFAVAAAAGARRDESTDWWATLAVELDARTPSPRSREVARRLGRQLARAGSAAWPAALVGRLREADALRPPIVLGVLVAAADPTGPPEQVALVSLHHHAASAIGAAVRLLALDPLRLVASQAALAPLIAGLAAEAPTWDIAPARDLPALGGARIEILAEVHGHWDARLFVG